MKVIKLQPRRCLFSTNYQNVHEYVKIFVMYLIALVKTVLFLKKVPRQVKTMRTHCLLLVFVFSIACSLHFSPEIEEVLLLAGDNRGELEKVLKHYARIPGDSLKLRAAEFLIVNMPGKYSAYYDAPWNDVATVSLRWTSSSDKQLVLDTYRLGEPVRKDDVTYITAEYLINNIDLAFKVWQEQPWGKTIPYDVFREEILPYRVATEPLENWREKVLASFADLYLSFKNDTAITTVEACSQVNDRLPRFRMDKDFPNMSYSQLMATTRGTCDAMAALSVFAMRGLGIPVTLDFTNKWIGLPYGHSWNSVWDNHSNNHISFMGCQSNPGKPHQGTTLMKAKAYRRFYGNQQNVRLDAADIPPLLHNINYISDVTSETEYCIDIWIPIPKDHLKPKGHIFLAILNGMEWQPVAWGTATDYNLKFNSVKSGLYLPIYYHNGIQTPAGYPFKLQSNTASFFKPYSSNTYSFKSIAPINSEWLHQMRGAKFEVANRSDFSDAKTVYTIETPGLGFHTVPIKLKSSYRYVRYITTIGKRCHVSILEFYNENNEKLQGTVIGTPGVNTTRTNDKVFDGDTDTFFEAASEKSWVGLDLGEPRRIAKIRYLPRTDGNSIYEGHVYELFYWEGSEWHSLGTQKANSDVLQYKVPARALFFLKNVTKNRIYKMPFIIENGMQQWFLK